MENLDVKCADLGKKLAELDKVEEKLLTDALAVLEEQGVYAFFLYLKARGGEGGSRVVTRCHDFLSCTPEGAALLQSVNGDVFAALQTLAEDLDNLLLARDLLRQALIYGRYHVKASAGSGVKA